MKIKTEYSEDLWSATVDTKTKGVFYGYGDTEMEAVNQVSNELHNWGQFTKE